MHDFGSSLFHLEIAKLKIFKFKFLNLWLCFSSWAEDLDPSCHKLVPITYTNFFSDFVLAKGET